MGLLHAWYLLLKLCEAKKWFKFNVGEEIQGQRYFYLLKILVNISTEKQANDLSISMNSLSGTHVSKDFITLAIDSMFWKIS